MSYGQPEEYNNVIDNNAIDMVPRWFEMLKELRNGTISYIQLIKREQIRPPVRPVCRRLGVAKLSDIVSEDILYRAIVQVAESQSQGGGRATRDDNNDNEALNGSPAMRVDMNMNMMKLNLQGQKPGQGQYPPNLNGSSAWAYQQQQLQQQQQQQQRQPRQLFEATPNRTSIQSGHIIRPESHHQQIQLSTAKALMDRQTRLSYHGMAQQYGTYADLENELNYARRLENPQDPYGGERDLYGGEREVQNFGQQLFSGQDVGPNGLSNNSSLYQQQQHDISMRQYGRPELLSKSTGSINGSINKPYTSNNRAVQSMSNSLNFNTLRGASPLGPCGPGTGSGPGSTLSSTSDPQGFSPLDSPRTPRPGPYNHLGGNPGVGTGPALGSGALISPRTHLGNYTYPTTNQQGQNHSPGHADPRLAPDNTLNTSVRPYASMAPTPPNVTPRATYHTSPNTNGDPGQLTQPPSNSNSNSNNNKFSNYNSSTGQYLMALPSPRTTSFMPFGSGNLPAQRSLNDFGEISAGSDFSGSDGLSQQSADESTPPGDHNNVDYYFKGDYPLSLVDPIHTNRDHNTEILCSSLESNFDSNMNFGFNSSRFASTSRPWESL